ncbi:zinc-binding dehydrogenase [Mycobacterium stomatepiae]|nr:zinc-binding dehydrogenase [Mycobacterium stomatepiae]
MKAWQMVGFGEPLQCVELPDPTPGKGEVLIDIRAAGLCHSDVAMAAGILKPFPHKLPIVLGHEIAGVIAAVGDGATEYAVGDRVGVYQLVDGHGDTRDGGFAQRTVASVEALVAIPDGTSYVQAAVGTDAGMTSYHAVISAGGVRAGTKLGIIGLGGLGTIGARVGTITGATVYGADPQPVARQRGYDAGIVEAFDDVSEFNGLNLDVVIDFAGFGTTTAVAIEVIKPGGRIVQVGLGVAEATINTLALVSKQVELIGSLGGDAHDIAAVYDLFASGQLVTPLVEITFDDLPRALRQLDDGTAPGRFVICH